VRREAREEVGAEVAGFREVACVAGRWHGRRDVLWVFAARWPGGPVLLDGLELADFAWFSRDALPARLSPATQAALAATAAH